MNDSIDTKQVTVTIQENGIIRAPDGYLIARLEDEIDYDSLTDERSYPSDDEIEDRGSENAH